MSLKRLCNEYKKILENPYYNFSISLNDNNLYKWNFVMIGPPDTFYEQGIFKGYISFPKQYPNRPPTVYFHNKVFHPNVYKSGKVCMSTLHEGEDEYGNEDISERWGPSNGVNTILMGLLSIFTSPNLESPANVDASKLLRSNLNQYKKIIYKLVSNSQK